MSCGWQARRRLSTGVGIARVDVRSGARTNVANETTTLDAAGRFERARLFLSEVRNELKRVT